MTNVNEIWRPIPNYNGRYFASNLGRIKSVDWVSCNGKRRKGKILKQQHESNGYLQVGLITNGTQLRILSHRIIAKIFIEKAEGKEFVNHINGIKDDNRAINLEWCTKSENSKHSFTIGKQCNKGENHPSNKLTDELVKQIRTKFIPRVYTSRRLAAEYGISKTNVLDIVNRKIWTHI